MTSELDLNTKKCGVAQLFMSSRLSDVTVYVGRKKDESWKFPAHKLVLCASSPVLNALVSEEYEPSGEKVEIIIRDISPYIFYKLMLFLYRGTLYGTSLPEVLGILHAADTYEISKLKTLCFEEILKLQITLDNFWDLFLHYICFGENLTSKEIKLNMFTFLDENASQLLKHKKFLLLERDVVLNIVSRDSLNASKEDICEALEHWSTLQCISKRVAPTARNKKSILGNTLHGIIFRLMVMDNYSRQEKREPSQTKLVRWGSSEELLANTKKEQHNVKSAESIDSDDSLQRRKIHRSRSKEERKEMRKRHHELKLHKKMKEEKAQALQRKEFDDGNSCILDWVLSNSNKRFLKSKKNRH